MAPGGSAGSLRRAPQFGVECPWIVIEINSAL
jgi:hypothetical protein